MSFLFIIVLIVIVACLIIINEVEKKHHILMNEVLESFVTEREVKELPSEVRENYKKSFNEVRKHNDELDNSIYELKEYRKELTATYEALIAKTIELEKSNEALEKRVMNLSNLNSLARNVLLVDNMEVMIDRILDAYFILTGVKRISLYLWQDGCLVRKKVKGGIDFVGEVFCDECNLRRCEKLGCGNIYKSLARKFKVSEEEEILTFPLVVQGKELGVIYVIEEKKKLEALDKETIGALVIQTSIAINNAQVYIDLGIKERMSNELELAANIQKQIIPQNVNEVFGLTIANYFEPAKEIGGDYYDYFIHDKNYLYVTMADVSGKGVPAAFLMSLARAILRTINTIRSLTPKQNLNALNRIIYEDIADDMFITMMHCRYDYNTKTLSYSNAGHHPIIIYRASTDEILTLTVKGPALGFKSEHKFHEAEIILEKNDVVVLYTDGVIEAENKEKELFGIDRLKEVLFKNKEQEPEVIKEKLLKAINKFTDKLEQDDDITFVIFKSNE